MKNGICPKCDSNAVIANLRLESHETDPWVDVTEPEPPNKPFIWVPKTARSLFSAYVYGNCGYTEFYAENYKELADGHNKGSK